MEGIAARYKRWRHTRGFGVHSPLAYRIVRDVVRPRRGYAYYGDAEINDTFEGRVDRLMWRHARMLLRLCALLRPRSVYLPQGIHAAFPTAVTCAGSDVRQVHRLSEAPACDMICSTDTRVPIQLLKEYLQIKSRVKSQESRVGGKAGGMMMDRRDDMRDETGDGGRVRCVAMRRTPEGWADELFDVLEEGLMLEGTDGLIVIARPGMQKVRYTLLF